jgi:hypothetical protein
MTRQYRTLALAAQAGDVADVERHLAGGADINGVERITVDKEECVELEQTALMAAASSGHMEVVKLLLVRGADVNQVNNFDQSAFSDAMYAGHGEIARLLLERGANPAAFNDEWRELPTEVATGMARLVCQVFGSRPAGAAGAEREN